jgi:hypothetical protein
VSLQNFICYERIDVASRIRHVYTLTRPMRAKRTTRLRVLQSETAIAIVIARDIAPGLQTDWDMLPGCQREFRQQIIYTLQQIHSIQTDLWRDSCGLVVKVFGQRDHSIGSVVLYLRIMFPALLTKTMPAYAAGGMNAENVWAASSISPSAKSKIPFHQSVFDWRAFFICLPLNQVYRIAFLT